jgi:hypothetical protein
VSSSRASAALLTFMIPPVSIFRTPTYAAWDISFGSSVTGSVIETLFYEIGFVE